MRGRFQASGFRLQVTACETDYLESEAGDARFQEAQGLELYGLTSQMRRACAAIPANIAEGCGRGSNADLARFLQIALGSASELENHLLLAQDLSFLQPVDYERLTGEAMELKRMLTAFVKNLKTFARKT